MKRVKLKSGLIKRFANKKYGSQKALADELGVSANSLYGWTNENARFPVEIALKISDLMGVNLKDIRDYGEDSLNDLEKEISSLKKAVNVSPEEIEDLKKDVESLWKVVNTLLEKVEKLENEGLLKRLFK